jgi:hypothetical protein
MHAFIIDILFPAINLIFIGIGVSIAWQGLRTWRKQIHGQVNVDLARRVASAVYRIRNGINDARIGIAEQNVDQFRKRYVDAVTELDSSLLEAEFLWGRPIKDAAECVLRCGTNFWLNVRRRFNLTHDNPGKIPDHLVEDFSKYDGLVYGMETDSFGSELAKAVRDVETILNQQLPRR